MTSYYRAGAPTNTQNLIAFSGTKKWKYQFTCQHYNMHGGILAKPCPYMKNYSLLKTSKRENKYFPVMSPRYVLQSQSMRPKYLCIWTTINKLRQWNIYLLNINWVQTQAHIYTFIHVCVHVCVCICVTIIK